EWYDFEREAINQLRQHIRSIIVQILDWPSFGLPAAWSVEERGGWSDGKRYSCTYEVWSRYYDYKLYSAPLERVRDLNRLSKPTITRQGVDTVPDEEVLALLRRAETLQAISPRGGWNANHQSRWVSDRGCVLERISQSAILLD